MIINQYCSIFLGTTGYACANLPGCKYTYQIVGLDQVLHCNYSQIKTRPILSFPSVLAISFMACLPRVQSAAEIKEQLFQRNHAMNGIFVAKKPLKRRHHCANSISNVLLFWQWCASSEMMRVIGTLGLTIIDIYIDIRHFRCNLFKIVHFLRTWNCHILLKCFGLPHLIKRIAIACSRETSIAVTSAVKGSIHCFYPKQALFAGAKSHKQLIEHTVPPSECIHRGLAFITKIFFSFTYNSECIHF